MGWPGLISRATHRTKLNSLWGVHFRWVYENGGDAARTMEILDHFERRLKSRRVELNEITRSSTRRRISRTASKLVFQVVAVSALLRSAIIFVAVAKAVALCSGT